MPKPKTIKISGFRGTQCWGPTLQVATIDEFISVDDIKNYLKTKGVDKSMEAVRKNKELAKRNSIMKEHGVPDWYVEPVHTQIPILRAHACICNDGTGEWRGLRFTIRAFTAHGYHQPR